MDRWTKIDRLLSLVSKPTRYLGNEVNSIHKDHRNCRLKVALAFPDLYEIGMSHLGLKILYKILNDLPGVVAERVYAPGDDLAAILEREGISLFSLEERVPLRDFDVIGFTLAHELNYTNVLWILKLAGIPLRTWERNDDDPLIIAGGPATANPEPMSEFIDLFCIGDGEGFIVDFIKSLIENRGIKRGELLLRLAQIPGSYVPSLYEAIYDEEGRFKELVPKDRRAPYPIQRRLEENLDTLSFPTSQIVPFMEIIHDRANLEIQRGCTQGCRFCQAGIIYRPVRRRSLDCLKDQAKRVIAETGYEEVSFSSLSPTDYCEVQELVSWFINEFKEKKVALSLPSLRVDSSVPELASLIVKIKKTGLTLAPEAGTERLRRVINKRFNEEDLFETIEACFRKGWNSIKLYFMIGLPTERREDIEGIVDLVLRIKSSCCWRGKLKVCISPFVPKPHTPFQWEGQAGLEELREKIDYLKGRLFGMKGVELNWHQVEASFLEAVFARGDRRLGRVLVAALEEGCRFDSWTNEFKFSYWKEAFKKTGIDPSFYAHRRIDFEENLPWDHISLGVKKEYLINECKMAYQEETTPDCRYGCQDCGACFNLNKEKRRVERNGIRIHATPRPQRRIELNQRFRVRVEFTKGPPVKYLSHLNMITTFARALRRANIPIAFSQGYHPHPRLSFGPALKVGITSKSEYADIELASFMNIEELKERLNKSLPDGIYIQKASLISPKARSLSSIININTYQVEVKGPQALDEEISRFLKEEEVWISRNGRRINLRESVRDIRTVYQNTGVWQLEIIMWISSGGGKLDEVVRVILPSYEILNIERTGQYHLREEELISPMEMKI